MNDTQINDRQVVLLNYLAINPLSTRDQLEEVGKASRITVIRDLNYLMDLGWVEQAGGGKYVKYRLKQGRELLAPVDLDEYFAQDADERRIKYERFNAGVMDSLTGLLTPEEVAIFEQGKDRLTGKLATLDKTLVKRELERFTIELAWKSSQIEGNTYSLLETEELIKNKKEARGHDRQEAVMILNHKDTFDLILAQKDTFKDMGLSDIRAIHAQLTKDLGIKNNIREAGVGITGTRYLPPDNKWSIEEALTKLVNLVGKTDIVQEKALILLGMISYLQPFTDGNKRTARMASNAVLLAHGYFPLSYRSVDEVEYKKALILFYEQNNLFHLKRLFVEQQRFAIDNYFK